MPRSRFAQAVSPTSERPERASVREALWFDVEAAETPGDKSLSESRGAFFDHTVMLLGATHLILGVACIARHPSLLWFPMLSNPLLPLALIVLLDGFATLALMRREKLDVAPHTVIRPPGAAPRSRSARSSP